MSCDPTLITKSSIRRGNTSWGGRRVDAEIICAQRFSSPGGPMVSAGLVDDDGDTKVEVERTPDDDIVRMTVGDNTGNFDVSSDVFSLSTGASGMTVPSATGAGVNGGSLTFRSGSSTLGNSGAVVAESGLAIVGNSGNATFSSGNVVSGSTGNTTVSTGQVSTSGESGNVNVTTGNSVSALGSAGSGQVVVRTGDNSRGVSGGVFVITGQAGTDGISGFDTSDSGSISLATGAVQDADARSGGISVQTGEPDDSDGSTGTISIRSGNAVTHSTGRVQLVTGVSRNGLSGTASNGILSLGTGLYSAGTSNLSTGAVTIFTGGITAGTNTTTRETGPISIATGNADGYQKSGDVSVKTGFITTRIDGGSNQSGSINLATGEPFDGVNYTGGNVASGSIVARTGDAWSLRAGGQSDGATSGNIIVETGKAGEGVQGGVGLPSVPPGYAIGQNVGKIKLLGGLGNPSTGDINPDIDSDSNRANTSIVVKGSGSSDSGGTAGGVYIIGGTAENLNGIGGDVRVRGGRSNGGPTPTGLDGKVYIESGRATEIVDSALTVNLGFSNVNNRSLRLGSAISADSDGSTIIKKIDYSSGVLKNTQTGAGLSSPTQITAADVVRGFNIYNGVVQVVPSGFNFVDLPGASDLITQLGGILNDGERNNVEDHDSIEYTIYNATGTPFLLQQGSGTFNGGIGLPEAQTVPANSGARFLFVISNPTGSSGYTVYRMN